MSSNLQTPGTHTTAGEKALLSSCFQFLQGWAVLWKHKLSKPFPP